MSTILAIPAMNFQKRKRNIVSYAELDQLPDLFGDDEDIIAVPQDESSDDESDNDDRTYSRHKVTFDPFQIQPVQLADQPKKTPKKTPKKKKAKHAHPRQKVEKPFPFMELPPELRDMIYEMALTEDAGVGIATKSKAYRRTICRAIIGDEEYRYRRRHRQRPTGRGRPTQSQESDEEPQLPSLVPNLLAVSKQIHHEAVNILYGQDLKFHDADALHRFLAIIGPSNQKRLQSVDIVSFCTGRYKVTINHCAFMSLAAATNLKTLRLNKADFRGWHTNAKGFARLLYGNAHYFLEAYGAANGRRDAAVDILEIDEEVFDSFWSYRYRHGTVTKQPTLEENKVLFRAELCRLLGAN
jgi:hypothetical protein